MPLSMTLSAPKTPVSSRHLAFGSPPPTPSQQETPEKKGRQYNTFLFHTYDFLCDPRNSEIVCWGERGDSFLVKNPAALANDILPVYFKHNNITSFVRQLNIYGFHKQSSADPGVWVFSHPKFRKGHREALVDIKRRVSSETITRSKVAELSSEKNHLSTSVKSLEDKIQSLQETVRDLRQKLDASRQSEAILKKDLSELARFVCTITPNQLPESKKRRMFSEPSSEMSETGATMQKYLTLESSPNSIHTPTNQGAITDAITLPPLPESTLSVPAPPWNISSSLSLEESPSLFSFSLPIHRAEPSPSTLFGQRSISPHKLFSPPGHLSSIFADESDPLRFDHPSWDTAECSSNHNTHSRRQERRCSQQPHGYGTNTTDDAASYFQDSIAESLSGLGIDPLYDGRAYDNDNDGNTSFLAMGPLKEETKYSIASPAAATIATDDVLADADRDNTNTCFGNTNAGSENAHPESPTTWDAASHALAHTHTHTQPHTPDQASMQHVHALAEKLIEALAQVCQFQEAAATASAIVHGVVSHMQHQQHHHHHHQQQHQQPAPARMTDCKPWSSAAYPVDV